MVVETVWRSVETVWMAVDCGLKETVDCRRQHGWW